MPDASLDGRFVHLHLHSHYSLLDGANRTDRLVSRCKELGMDAVAITDHGNLHAAAEFYKTAKKADLKPILGVEAYVAPDLDGRPSDRTNRTNTGKKDGGFHLVLLCENQTGWSHLLKLCSDAYLNGFYFKPRMDKGTLTQWSDGLIAINGHLGSSIAYHLVEFHKSKQKETAHWDRAVAEARWHAEVFKPNADGEPRFYLELQRHEVQLQHDINPLIVKLAEELDLPLVCDNDAHFLTADDWDAHDSLCCISMGKIKADEQRLRYPRDLYVKSPKEMWDAFGADHPEALRNTVRIADRCNVDIDFEANHAPVVKVVRKAPPTRSEARETREPATALSDARGGVDDAVLDGGLLASIDAPEGSTDWFKQYCANFELLPFDAEHDTESEADLARICDDVLRELCEAGLIWRYGRDGVTAEIRARLERELKVLSDKIISAYFLIVWDFVNHARQTDIPSLARGSGVGTMVGYVLGLSNACPVEYGLLFERFTDPDRSEYPDIDIDMCQDGRAAVIDYVRKKYGHVAQIITFGTLKARAAVRDVGRVLDVPLGEVDEVCKLIGDGLKTTLDSALTENPDLQPRLDGSPHLKAMYSTAQRLEGFARHAGVHAAGVIVATQPLDNIVPLYRAPGKDQKDGEVQVVTQWDGPTCEAVGLLKMDFLGLRTLSIIERAKLLIRQAAERSGDVRSFYADALRLTEGEDLPADPLDLERLGYEDARVFELFQRGDTAGVFQFESGGMRGLLMAMKPDRLTDLIAANALYRPGPMELIPNYNARKHGRESVPKVHPIVDRLTEETYGIMIYQEQVMQVLNELGGIHLRTAYSIIKAISKKKMSVIDAARADFIEGAAKQGVEKKQSNELFDLILKFAGYGFNKSHSTGYAIVAYQTAWLKAHFPTQFMAAVLTYESVNTDKVVEYIDACKTARKPDGGSGIEVRPPDVNLSDVAFTVVHGPGEAVDASHGHIRFGLTAVKGLGEKAMAGVVAERRENGPFRGLFDFCERVDLRSVNKASLEALVRCGAFDGLYGLDARAALAESIEDAAKAGQRLAADRASGQMGMFGAPEPEPAAPTGGAPGVPAPPGVAPDEPPLPTTTAWSMKQALDFEKQVMGLYASSHPLDAHADELRCFSSCDLETANRLPAGQKVILGGMLSRARVVLVKKGRSAGSKMGILTLEDAAGHKLDAVAFADAYATNCNHLAADRVVFLEGKIDRRREEPNLIIDRAIPIEEAAATLTRTVRVRLDAPADVNGEGAAALKRLRDVFRQAGQRCHTGQTASADVRLEVHQCDAVVGVRLPKTRVAADDLLFEGVRAVFSDHPTLSIACDRIGPPPVTAAASVAEFGEAVSEGDLNFAMHDDGGASIDRY